MILKFSELKFYIYIYITRLWIFMQISLKQTRGIEKKYGIEIIFYFISRYLGRLLRIQNGV